MPKNILILNYEHPPLGGGQANASYHFLKEFADYPQYTFDLITSSSDKEKFEKFAENINIYYLDISKKGQNLHNQSAKNLLNNLFKSFFKSLDLIKQNKINKENKYDIIICWSYPAMILGYFLKKWKKIEYISLLRGAEIPFYEKKWEKLDKLVFKWFAPILWKNSKYVIANSNYLKKLALKYAPNQEIKIVSNGIKLSDFEGIPRNVDKKLFQIILASRLSDIKGIKEFFEGFKIFAQDKEDVLLNSIGDGPLLDYCTDFIKQNSLKNKVKLHGKISHNDLIKNYFLNDVFILPSKNEGMSNSLLEAMASGLPVIMTDVGGKDELFDNNGRIIEKENPEDIAQKLNLAYTAWKNGKLEELGQKSLYIIKDNDWKNKANLLLKYLE